MTRLAAAFFFPRKFRSLRRAATFRARVTSSITRRDARQRGRCHGSGTRTVIYRLFPAAVGLSFSLAAVGESRKNEQTNGRRQKGWPLERGDRSHCACTLEFRTWRTSTSAATQWPEREGRRQRNFGIRRERRSRRGERERESKLKGRTRGKWRMAKRRRRQFGQTLNNLDNGRTALNSRRFVQAYRLIRLAGRLQRAPRGMGRYRNEGRGSGEFSVSPSFSRLPTPMRATRTDDVLISLESGYLASIGTVYLARVLENAAGTGEGSSAASPDTHAHTPFAIYFLHRLPGLPSQAKCVDRECWVSGLPSEKGDARAGPRSKSIF